MVSIVLDHHAMRDVVRLVELSRAPIYRDPGEAERLGPWVGRVREVTRGSLESQWDRGFREAAACTEVALEMLRSRALARAA